MRDLDPLVNEAVSVISIVPRAGRPHSLSLEQRLNLLLIKQLVGESIRMFLNMLMIFSMISGIGVSYKTIERLYSDDEVIIAIENIYVLILKKEEVTSSRATGDCTGYSLRVKKNYESYAQKLKDLAKDSPDNREEKDKTRKANRHKKRLFGC